MLDTWFSSGLWPFSTLGWPDESAPDFQRCPPYIVALPLRRQRNLRGGNALPAHLRIQSRSSILAGVQIRRAQARWKGPDLSSSMTPAMASLG